MDLDAELDRLFAAPLEAFTPTRDELARSLKSAGDADTSVTVKKLKKPIVSAWVLNQLVRAEPQLTKELVDAGEAIETAGGTDELRRASAERKRVIAELLKAARALLQEAGHNPSATTLDRVGKSLLATTTQSARTALTEGRLSEDLTPSGLESWGLSAFAEEPGPDEGGRAEARDKAEHLAADADAAERAAREAERAVADARAELERAEGAARVAVARAEDARARADKALKDL
jgi:hypothetical protein